MPVNILKFVSLLSLAILTCSFTASPANALSLDISPNDAHHLGHHGVAKKKRADSNQARPASCSVAASAAKQILPSSAPAATKPTTTTTKPVSTPLATSPPSCGGKGKVGLGWANGDDGALKNFITPKVSVCGSLRFVLLQKNSHLLCFQYLFMEPVETRWDGCPWFGIRAYALGNQTNC